MRQDFNQNEQKMERNINFNDSDAVLQYGFGIAADVKGSLESVKDSLDSFYQTYIDSLKMNEEQKKQSVVEKEQMVAYYQNKLEHLEVEHNQIEQKKQTSYDKINEYKDRVLSVKSEVGTESVQSTILIFGIVVLVFLTLFLFIFYSSSIYSVLFGVPEDSLGFIIPDVFGASLENGVSTFLLIVLLPMIFLALGYVMHNIMTKNETLEKEGRKKKYGILIGILALSFAMDATIGYKISESLHHNKFMIGETNDMWQFSMIYSDVNFYLILLLGFATYILWGICLHQVLSNPAMKSLDERARSLIERINENIKDEQEKIKKIDADLLINSENKSEVKIKIAKLQQEIIDIRKGQIVVHFNSVKGYVGAFKNGWKSFLANYRGKEYAERAGIELNKISEQWLEIKKMELKEPIKL